MTTYNTGNPVPSADARDRHDNSQTLDEVITGPLTYYVNRIGNNVLSLKGMESMFNAEQLARANAFTAAQAARDAEFDQAQADRIAAFAAFLFSSGYETPVDYAPGISITRPTQIVRYLGELYRPKDSALPFVTTTFAADSAKWIANGDNSLRQELAGPNGPALLGFNRAPISAAVGSLARVVAAIPVSIWEYENLVSVKPNPADPTTWNWTPALLAAINSADGIKSINVIIPINIEVGKIEITGKHKWSVSGGGTIKKITKDPVLGIYQCNNVNISNLFFNGNIAWDEANNGSVIPGWAAGTRTGYAVGVYAQECNDLSITDCDFYDFAQDPISIRGKYVSGRGVPGSSGATLENASLRVLVSGCNIYNFRNTAVYLAGVHGGAVLSNQIHNDDAFGYIRGNGIYLVDWCDGVLCLDNKMNRIGDNGIGVGEVGNPIAQNKHISLISNLVDRCVYMSILVAGAEDVLVYDNTLLRGVMQQALVPQAFILPGNPGSLQIKGGNTSRTKRVRAIANTVDLSYQRGIYVFDDSGVDKDNWTTDVELTSNTARRSQQENIYVNMALPVGLYFNKATEGVTTGFSISGAHDMFNNLSWGNASHGVLSSQLNTFAGQEQNPTLAYNRCWSNGLNGIQVLGGSAARAQLLHNKCRNNGAAGTTLGGKAGIRLNGVTDPLVQGNECLDNYGPGIMFDSCTRFVAEAGNKLTNNGLDAALPQAQRAGIYVRCTATAFREGRLMSNKMFAGANQQVGYAAEFDTVSGGTTPLLVCIGNEPDAHPLSPQNVIRKSWTDIYMNV